MKKEEKKRFGRSKDLDCYEKGRKKMVFRPGPSSGVYSLTLSEGPGRGRGKEGVKKNYNEKEKAAKKTKKIMEKELKQQEKTKKIDQ